MSDADALHTSKLREAITKLARSSAKRLREDTYFRLPVTMQIADADLCTYLARNESSFLFLPDHESFRTRLVLRTTNEAWQHDKLPTLAICPTERSAKEVQRTTAIESISAERFFGDLQLARPVTQTFTGKKSYVIGHDHNPKGRFDEIVLPPRANVVVYDAQHFSSEQLTSLCEPVSQVGGRLILCGDWNAMDRAHPELAETISDALGHGLPEVSVGNYPENAWELGNELESYSTMDNILPRCADSNPWVIVATCWWEIGANCVRSIHTSQEEALNSVPAVFAEEWRDYEFFFGAGKTDCEPPSVSAAEWRAPEAPEIGQRVRIENHAVVSVVSLDEHLPLPEELRQDTRGTDPLAKTRPFLVFHAEADNPKLFPDDYTLVAKIEAQSIDHAVFLSQHTEVPWTQYPGVASFGDKPRSTQVGDVIIDHDVPKRYLGAAGWCPATTTIDQTHVPDNAPALVSNAPKRQPEEQRITTHSLKL